MLPLVEHWAVEVVGEDQFGPTNQLHRSPGCEIYYHRRFLARPVMVAEMP
jgi:hypothetical protein